MPGCLPPYVTRSVPFRERGKGRDTPPIPPYLACQPLPVIPSDGRTLALMHSSPTPSYFRPHPSFFRGVVAASLSLSLSPSLSLSVCLCPSHHHRYPTYREGLRAQLAEEKRFPPAPLVRVLVCGAQPDLAQPEPLSHRTV